MLVPWLTQPYSRPRAGNLKCRTMHLTNYAINKLSEVRAAVSQQDGCGPASQPSGSLGFVCLQDFVRDEDEARGSKRSLSSVMETMKAKARPAPCHATPPAHTARPAS